MKKKKVLIVGASGFIGNYIYSNLKQKSSLTVQGTYCKSQNKDLIEFDYTLEAYFEKIYKIAPDYLIWAAGEKDLNVTEDDISKTLDNNYFPFKSFLSNFPFSKNTKIIFISSDYVFEGSRGSSYCNILHIPST